MEWRRRGWLSRMVAVLFFWLASLPDQRAAARDILRGLPVTGLRELADSAQLHPIIRYKIRLEGEASSSSAGHPLASDSSSHRSAAIQSVVRNVTETLRLHGIHTAPPKRVFRHAGVHEARHVAFGLDKWYRNELLFLGAAGFGKKRRTTTTTTELHGPMPSPAAQSHAAVDAVEVVLNASNGVFEHLDVVEAAAVPRLFYTPSDSLYNSYQKQDMQSTNVDTAWDTQAGSERVVIQVVDSGVYGDGKGEHPDLQNIWENFGEHNHNSACDDGVDDDGNGFVDDCYGYNFADDTSDLEGDGMHGMHVAGTAAADSDNNQGVAGVAGGKNGVTGAQLMISTVFGTTTSDGFAEAIAYGVDNGANISCNSWGYTVANAAEQSVLDAIDYAYDAGVYVVFAAGNDNDDGKWYPAYYSKAIAVAATDSTDNTRATFSNYGDWIDISAPGVDIVSTGYYDGSYGYYYSDGTSMACPHVVGVIALVLSQVGTSRTYEEILSCMSSTATDIDDVNSGYEGELGAGLIDASAFLLGCAPTPLPTGLPASLPLPAPSAAPTDLPAPSPTGLPIPSPSKLPVLAPTMLPVPAPTELPVPSPTELPAPAPSSLPIPAPSLLPVPAPSKLPVPAPSLKPTGPSRHAPTPVPTTSPKPTTAPAPAPTAAPTAAKPSDDGPDDGALQSIGGSVVGVWSATKNLLKDIWAEVF